MNNQLTIGTIWEDRESGGRYELDGVNDGRVQISPVAGGDYRVMAEKSLRKNYKLVAMKKEAVETPPPEPEPEEPVQPEPSPEPAEAHAEGEAERAPAGRVKLADGKVIAGAHFITQVCGQSRETTYKVDSPIRWLLKPAGDALLKGKGAIIVYGQPITR